MICIVSIKYVSLILRVDNQGEGGILTLAARIGRFRSGVIAARRWEPLRALCGAALFFGDAVITPTIAVLSAVEHVPSLWPHLASTTVPVTIGILVANFAVKWLGTV